MCLAILRFFTGTSTIENTKEKGMAVLSKNVALGMYSTHNYLVYKALYKCLLTQLKSSFNSVW